MEDEVKTQLKRKPSVPPQELENLIESDHPKTKLFPGTIDQIWQSLNKSNLPKKTHSKSTPTTNQKAPQKPKPGEFNNLPEQAVGRIKKILQSYRQSMNFTRIQPTQKQRAQIKERFIKCLLIGIEELKITTQITPQEKSLISMEDKTMFELVKKLAFSIQAGLISFCNEGQRDHLKRKYTDRYKIIYSNLKNEHNLSLRRKILTQQMKSKELCTVNQIELYNPEKRNEILEKEKNIMRQNTITHSVLRIKEGVIQHDEEEEKEQSIQVVEMSVKKVQVEKKNSGEQLGEELRGMIGEVSRLRFENRLKEDLPEEQGKKLIERLNKIYQLRK